MKAATARAMVSPSTRSAYEANLFARSNRAAKRLIPIPTRTIGDSKILNQQIQLKLCATYLSPNKTTLRQNWCTQAETKQKSRICRIQDLKLCNDPD